MPSPEKLEDSGAKVYEQLVYPSLLIVRAQHRSGMMLNRYDCYKTGVKVLKMGWLPSKVGDSLFFEDKCLEEKPMDCMK